MFLRFLDQKSSAACLQLQRHGLLRFQRDMIPETRNFGYVPPAITLLCFLGQKLSAPRVVVKWLGRKLQRREKRQENSLHLQFLLSGQVPSLYLHIHSLHLLGVIRLQGLLIGHSPHVTCHLGHALG